MQDELSEGEVMASHTPKKLLHKSLECLVASVIENAFPCSVKLLGSYYDYKARFTHDPKSKRTTDPRRLDVIIMSSEEREPDFLPCKIDLLERLQQIRQWFNKMLGTQNNEIKRQIRTAITERLELIDPFSCIPLFKYLLELLFGSMAGGCSDAAQFPFVPRVECELWRKDCPLYANVLRAFVPFDIEELSTHHIIFGSSEPLQVVLENSPFLKRVYLRNNVSADILLSIERHCPLIDTFHMEKCMGLLMVPVDCLYKTFFHRMDFDATMSFAQESSPLERLNQLSFTNLKCFSVGSISEVKHGYKRDSLLVFIHTLLFFYSHSIKITFDTMMPFTPALPEQLPECLKDISYSVYDCSLNGLHKWIARCTSTSENNVRVPLCNISQLTLSHPIDGGSDSVELVDFSKTWIKKLNCKKLTFSCMLEDGHSFIDVSSYIALFSEVGSILSALHMNIAGDIDLLVLCDIISACPNLEVLRIKLTKVHTSSAKQMKIRKLHKLTSLTMHSTSEGHAPLVHSFLEELIESSPELYALSLVLHDKPCEWLMSMASNKKLSGIDILRLSFHCFSISLREMTDVLKEESVGTAFYVYLIELLPHLKVLQLGSIVHCTFTQLTQIYRKSDLQINIWRIPSDNKEWYGW